MIVRVKYAVQPESQSHMAPCKSKCMLCSNLQRFMTSSMPVILRTALHHKNQCSNTSFVHKVALHANYRVSCLTGRIFGIQTLVCLAFEHKLQTAAIHFRLPNEKQLAVFPAFSNERCCQIVHSPQSLICNISYACVESVCQIKY